MSLGRVLIVDDEPQISRVLKRTLAAHDYDVRVAADGETGLDTFRDFGPDLVITDLQMPEMSGLDLCKAIRDVSEIPIIVLSVKRDDSAKVTALDAGADDYVTKPFSMEELLARVRVALRRSRPKGPTEAGKEAMKIEAGDFTIDLEKYHVTVSGNPVHLTPKEMEVLVYFVKNDAKVLTHRNVLNAVWGGNAVEQNEYLRVFVGNLRKKIEPDPSNPRYILTEPWVGYRFDSTGGR